MVRLIKIELYKIFTRKRSYIGFLAILIIVLLTEMALFWEGQSLMDFWFGSLSDSFYFQGSLLNGNFVTYLILNFLWVHVPLLIVIVTGDLLAGESNAGTFRIILTRPVKRDQLITTKFLAALVYTLSIVVFLAVLSYGLGLALLDRGDLLVIMGAINIIPADDVAWRFAAAFGFGFLSMVTVAALSIFLSGLARNSLGPILSTMAIIIIMTLISSFDIRFFSLVKPYLFTTYLTSWQKFFFFEPDIKDIAIDAMVLVIHIIIFYVATLVYFRKKDILS